MPKPVDFLKVAQEMFNLTPGMGLGTRAYNPMAGLERQRRRREAEGANADELMRTLTEAGVRDRDGMTAIFQRAYEPPERSFMRLKGGK